MRKLLTLAVITLTALSCGVPAQALNVEVGAKADITIEKDVVLDTSVGDIDAEYNAQHYDITLKTQPATWLTITPKIGIARGGLEYDIYRFGQNINVEADSEVGFSLGIETQADVYSIQGFTLSLIGAYRYSNVNIDDMTVNGYGIGPVDLDADINEWEVGGIVSKDLSGYGVPVVPYIGIVYSDLQGEISGNGYKQDIEADDNFGLRLGVNANINNNLTLSVSGKLIDEQSIAGAISVKF